MISKTQLRAENLSGYVCEFPKGFPKGFRFPRKRFLFRVNAIESTWKKHLLHRTSNMYEKINKYIIIHQIYKENKSIFFCE